MLNLPPNTSYLILAGFFVLQWIFAFVLGEILLKFATNLGVRNNTEIRWTSSTKPSLGGIIFFVSFLLSIVFYQVTLTANVDINNREFIGIVVVCTLGFVMGLADDAYNTRPWLKFIIQALCGIVAIVCGNYIRISDNDILNYSLTIFWFVGMMNSLNMLDNMDGITASVSSVSCIFILVLAYLTDHLFDHNFILVIGVLASLLAFLRYNWHPARMYMGDSGSQFIGAFLAFIAVKILWNAPLENASHSTSLFLFLLPISFFIITISDTTTVSINRLLRKQSPFVGGKDHTTHHLVYAGLKQRSVALLFIIISAVGAGAALSIFWLKLYFEIWTVIMLGLILFAIFVTLFIVTKKFRNETK